MKQRWLSLARRKGDSKNSYQQNNNYCHPITIYVSGDNLRYFVINFIKFLGIHTLMSRNYSLTISMAYKNERFGKEVANTI